MAYSRVVVQEKYAHSKKGTISSFKRTNSLVKRLSRVMEDSIEEILAEASCLNLTMYLDECANSITQNSVPQSFFPAVCACVALHNSYSTFSKKMQAALRARILEKDAFWTLFYLELCLLGLYPKNTETATAVLNAFSRDTSVQACIFAVTNYSTELDTILSFLDKAVYQTAIRYTLYVKEQIEAATQLFQQQHATLMNRGCVDEELRTKTSRCNEELLLLYKDYLEFKKRYALEEIALPVLKSVEEHVEIGGIYALPDIEDSSTQTTPLNEELESGIILFPSENNEEDALEQKTTQCFSEAHPLCSCPNDASTNNYDTLLNNNESEKNSESSLSRSKERQNPSLLKDASCVSDPSLVEALVAMRTSLDAERIDVSAYSPQVVVQSVVDAGMLCGECISPSCRIVALSFRKNTEYGKHFINSLKRRFEERSSYSTYESRRRLGILFSEATKYGIVPLDFYFRTLFACADRPQTLEVVYFIVCSSCRELCQSPTVRIRMLKYVDILSQRTSSYNLKTQALVKNIILLVNRETTMYKSNSVEEKTTLIDSYVRTEAMTEEDYVRHSKELMKNPKLLDDVCRRLNAEVCSFFDKKSAEYLRRPQRITSHVRFLSVLGINEKEVNSILCQEINNKSVVVCCGLLKYLHGDKRFVDYATAYIRSVEPAFLNMNAAQSLFEIKELYLDALQKK